IVHNAVGAKHGIMVFVESPNEPRFHTFAMMPVNANEGEIFPEDIWTVEHEVERALFGGLLAMMMEEELKELDEYFQELTENYPVVGIRQEAVNNVKKTGYTTSFYFISHLFVKKEYQPINELYFNKPKISKKGLKEQFNVREYEPESFRFAINLYMKEPNVEPDEEILQQIVTDIETREGFPRGSYEIALNDNKINKYTGIGDKDNTLLIRNIVRQ
ncbi:DUF1672 family protein, partial [Metabacillus lacus]|uniref:DUF1672 family protein n=1 Tax=Metabacillus lacus TaxID=1983721 RepID=UPI0012AFD0D2